MRADSATVELTEQSNNPGKFTHDCGWRFDAASSLTRRRAKSVYD
jgi:hypothetical protein